MNRLNLRATIEAAGSGDLDIKDRGMSWTLVMRPTAEHKVAGFLNCGDLETECYRIRCCSDALLGRNRKD